MKISTIIRDTYMVKIYVLVFSFLTPLLIVLTREYDSNTFGKLLLAAINIYLWGSAINWATKYVFAGYIKKWDNGRDVDYNTQWNTVKAITTILCGIGYLLCILNDVEIERWIIYLVAYIAITNFLTGPIVVSDNYVLYRNKVIIVKNIQKYEIIEENILRFSYRDNYKYEIKIKKQLVEEIKYKLATIEAGV